MAKEQFVTTAENTSFSLEDLQVEEFEVADSRMGPDRSVIGDYPTCACCVSGGCCQCTCYPTTP